MKQLLKIDGMHCENCVHAIKEVLQHIDGVKSVRVDLAKGRAEVEWNAQDRSVDILCQAIEEIGFDASVI